MKYFKNLAVKFVIFSLLLLIIIPLWFSTFLNIHSIWAVRASFFFLKIFKIASISCLLLLFIVWNKFKSFKFDFKLRESVIFGMLAFLFFVGSFYTQGNMSNMVQEGVIIEGGSINFDGERWLGFSLLSDTHLALYKNPISGNNYENIMLKKEIFLEEIPSKDFFVKFSGSWQDANGNNEFDGELLMFVNENSFDITEKFSSLKVGEANWMTLDIPEEILLIGKNELILKGVSENKDNDDIIITSQNVYVEANSFITADLGVNWVNKDEEFLWYITTKKNSFYSFIFKAGFILRIIGIIFLFLAVFGLKFSKLIVTKSYIELSFSTVFAYWVYWFSEFVKSQWELFAGMVAKTLFFLFKITGFDPVMFRDISVGVDVIGIEGFLAGIYDVCSGVDSMGLFTLAYFMLIVFHWRRIIFWKAFLMYIPGLIGIFLLNIIRVYILIVIGAKISTDFALNAFHTNAGMIFAIVYFLLFLPLALKVIEKKKN